MDTSAAATCSPGIPCTTYNIYEQSNADKHMDYNGDKTDGTLFVPSNTYSQTACDGNFMNQIYSRAYMEAQREVLMSEQIIHKPDSVLEYTCFDQFMNVAAENIDKTFSATQEWLEYDVTLETGDSTDTVTINDDCVSYFPGQTQYAVFESTRYDNLLEGAIFETLGDYIELNFDHTFMGGSITLDNNISSTLVPGAYSCAHMGAVWEISKCVDFAEDDRFRSFNHLAEYDPRSIPKACPEQPPTLTNPNPTPTTRISSDAVLDDSGTKLDNTRPGELLNIASITVPGDVVTRMPSDGMDTKCPPYGAKRTDMNTGISNDMIRIANNCNDELNPTDYPNPYSSFDMVKLYEDLTKGFGAYIPGTGNETGNIDCAAPIPTGIPVVTYTHSLIPRAGDISEVDRVEFLHYEHICPNPGCYYKPAGKVGIDINLPFPQMDDPGVSQGTCEPAPF